MKEFIHFYSQTFTVLGGPSAGAPPPAPTWQPPIDIYECRKGLHIVAELPGVDRERLQVSVQDGVLRIEGVREKPLPHDAEHVHQMEIPYGRFERLVRLPRAANVEKINARYENGYLTIEIPRNELHERR